jgi:aminoglycoside phosphotransferase (APT) family kinase protein
MSHPTLPYLTCLKNTFASLSAGMGSDPATAFQVATVKRMFDYMIAQRSDALLLKAGSYTAVLKILPEIEKLIGSVAELKAICTKANIDDFDQFQKLMGEIQRKLFAVNMPQATALCKAIVNIEHDYSRKFELAVIAQGAVADNKPATAVRNTREINEKALLDFIRSVYPQETELGIKQTSYIPGGYSKFTALINLSNAKSLPSDIVLRGDASATFGGASVVDEYRLIKPLYENGVCVPKPLGLEESGKVFGSRFMLVEKKSGVSIGHMFNLPKTPNKSIGDDCAVQLAAIHKVPLSALGNQINNASGRTSDKMLAWLDEGMAAWKPLKMPSAVFEVAFDWLRQHVSIVDKTPRTLVHGDYGLNNILIDNDKVSTILDWEFAHIGNPAYDLGYFYFMGRALQPWEDFLQAYGRAGVPIPDEDQLNYNILFAATRLGVMVCQTCSVFTSGAEPGLSGAVNLGGNFYEETIKRISGALDKVL